MGNGIHSGAAAGVVDLVVRANREGRGQRDEYGGADRFRVRSAARSLTRGNLTEHGREVSGAMSARDRTGQHSNSVMPSRCSSIPCCGDAGVSGSSGAAVAQYVVLLSEDAVPSTRLISSISTRDKRRPATLDANASPTYLRDGQRVSGFLWQILGKEWCPYPLHNRAARWGQQRRWRGQPRTMQGAPRKNANPSRQRVTLPA